MQLRRRVVLGMGAWGSLLALAACASDDSDDSGDGGDAVNTVPAQGFVDPNHLALSADGARLMALVADGVGVWSTSDGSRTTTFDVAVTEGLAVAPKGDLVAVGGTRARIHLLDATSGDEVRVLTGHAADASLRTLCFSPDGSRLASADEDGRVLLWEVADGSSTPVDLGDAHPASLAFDHRGATLAVGALDGPLQLVDAARGTVTRTLDALPQQGVSVSFSGDGRWLATAISATPKPGRVALVDTRTWQSARDLVTDLSPRSVVVSPDSQTVAVCDRRTKGVRLAPVAGGEVRTLETPDDTPRSVAWSPDGTTLYALGERLVAVDVESGKITRELT